MSSNSNRTAVDVLGFLACATMLSAAYFFGVRTWMEGTERSEHLLNETNAIKVQLEQESEEIGHASTSLQRIEGQLRAEGVSLDDATAITNRLISLGTIAESAGVVIETLTPRPLEKAAAFDRQPIAFKCSGDFAACLQILSELRQADRTIACRSVSFQRANANSTIVMNLDLVWFVRAGSSDD